MTSQNLLPLKIYRPDRWYGTPTTKRLSIYYISRLTGRGLSHNSPGKLGLFYSIHRSVSHDWKSPLANLLHTFETALPPSSQLMSSLVHVSASKISCLTETDPIFGVEIYKQKKTKHHVWRIKRKREIPSCSLRIPHRTQCDWNETQ